MIEIRLRTNGRSYSARARVDGKMYYMGAIVGASNKLAKLLRSKGIPDQPVEIYNPSGNLGMTYPSLYKWADFNYIKERERMTQELQQKELK